MNWGYSAVIRAALLGIVSCGCSATATAAERQPTFVKRMFYPEPAQCGSKTVREGDGVRTIVNQGIFEMTCRHVVLPNEAGRIVKKSESCSDPVFVGCA